MVEKINDKYNKSINKKQTNKKKKNNYNIKTNKSLLINGIQLILNSIIKEHCVKMIYLALVNHFY